MSREAVIEGTERGKVQAELDSGRRTDGLTTAEQAEIRQLRREVRQLKVERDVPKKAAAWFAREPQVIPSGDSPS